MTPGENGESEDEDEEAERLRRIGVETNLRIGAGWPGGADGWAMSCEPAEGDASGVVRCSELTEGTARREVPVPTPRRVVTPSTVGLFGAPRALPFAPADPHSSLRARGSS